MEMGDAHFHYQPLHVKLAGRPCLVVGGGKTAVRRVKTLLSCGAKLKVVAPVVEGSIETMAGEGRLHLEKRPFSEKDLDGQFLVVALTDDRALNQHIMNVCARKGVLCNGNGIDGSGDFIFPSGLRKGDVIVSISTSGSSPALSRWIREELDEILPEEITRLSWVLGEVRSRLRQEGLALSYDDWRKAIDEEILAEILWGEEENQDRVAEKIYRAAVGKPMFCLWGISHRTAPLDLREEFLRFLPEEHELMCLLREDLGNALFLSTCNRIEVYSFTGRARFMNAIKRIYPFDHSSEEIAKEAGPSYFYFGRRAIEHLLKVSSGLDSVAKGESQIRNQVRKAMAKARSAGCLNFPLDRILQLILRESRNLNLMLRDQMGPKSVGGYAMRRLLAEAKKNDLQKILVIGTGEAGRDLCYHISRLGRFELALAGGEGDRVSRLAQRFRALPLTYDKLDEALINCDAVLSASPRPGHLITADRMHAIMEKRGFRPLLIIDISMPRDFPDECASIHGVELIDLDDLASADGQRQLAESLKGDITRSAKRIMDWLEEREKAPVITGIRARAEQAWMAEREVLWRKSGLNDPKIRELIEESVRKTINRALHGPVLLLKKENHSPNPAWAGSTSKNRGERA